MCRTSPIPHSSCSPAYGTYILNQHGIDPIIAGLMLMPVFFVFGLFAYRVYYETFERRGSDAGVRGIAFFFGVAFVIEVVIILMFGVDQRSVQALYIGKSIDIGDMRIPLRLLVAFGVALTLTAALDPLSGAHVHRPRHSRRRPGRDWRCA